jgi:hypothetical protein
MVLSNNPPSALEFCEEATKSLAEFLENTPVIQTEDDARAGKLLVDRAVATIADAEAERDKLVRPLNEQVKTINDTFRGPREVLKAVCATLSERLLDFIQAEKAKREAEAEAKRLALQEAERVAREAEARESAARESASDGEVVDIASAQVAADATFKRYEQAAREAARAEKDTRVKIGGGFRKALSTRTKEVLTLQNWQAAIDEMGLSESLIEAILKEARAYRKASGHLPAGIIRTEEEVL